ncbi:HD domain-containing protein [Haloplasma contractile]|uniref:HD superfamily phosphohydrolase ral function prediction only protein n=1 Tax=Haloplasma contractile SSD-17B TaxID=1033810 RepID=U2FMW0_9MOLU|nr:HD domain-containing protein [Haloplasma contractile]ERJ12479.1 HD superfamily phosphohydrolase ral function prediction only protein [Haloplasma contractile SSD-17B]
MVKLEMGEIKVFRDPLYGYVKVYDKIFWDLIKTKEFQRLRRIHQLGGTHMVYHTAEHSRFSHSLGVYEVARRIIYEVQAIRKTLSKDQRFITLCAALLHDVGHGPFSHSFETVFKTNHEEYTVDIILGNTEVNKVLENYKPGFAKRVADVIAKKTKNKIMEKIITSQLDADRLDYLQRDAYFTGATYGEIDLDRILRSFLIVDGELAFKYSSMHAIEDYLMSRYHMYWQVYYHPVGMSYEIILMKLFERVKELIDTGYVFKTDIALLEKALSRTLTLDNYLELDEAWMLTKIKELSNENDSIVKDLSDRFLNRRLLKHINCSGKEMQLRIFNRLETLFDKYNIDKKYYLHKDILSKETYQYYNEQALNKSPILLYVQDQLIEIENLSQVVKGINQVEMKHDYKVFYPKEILLEKISEAEMNELHSVLN